jgi:hypothetical protein
MVASRFAKWAIKEVEEGWNIKVSIVEADSGRVIATFPKHGFKHSIVNIVRQHNRGRLRRAEKAPEGPKKVVDKN